MKYPLLLLSMLCLTVNALETRDVPEKIRSLIEQHQAKGDFASLEAVTMAAQRLTPKTLDELYSFKFALLHAIDKFVDPAYDLNNPPKLWIRVAPPKGYDSGISPEIIKDPKQREDYVNRTAANLKNVQKHHVQTYIRDHVRLIAFELSYMDETTYKELKIEEAFERLPQNVKRIFETAQVEFEARKKDSGKAQMRAAANQPR